MLSGVDSEASVAHAQTCTVFNVFIPPKVIGRTIKAILHRRVFCRVVCLSPLPANPVHNAVRVSTVGTVPSIYTLLPRIIEQNKQSWVFSVFLP